MIIYISSGNSISEVCRALWLFYKWIDKNYDFEVLEIELSKEKNSLKSITLLSSDTRFKNIEGTHLWINQSPFRPKHKRKNWYFSLKCYEIEESQNIDKTKIIYQTMRSPKNGGQHTNKTSSGVRAIYPPLKIEAISYDTKSQYQNKKLALFRLIQKIENMTQENIDNSKQIRYKDGKNLKRGEEVLVFRGDKFNL